VDTRARGLLGSKQGSKEERPSGRALPRSAPLSLSINQSIDRLIYTQAQLVVWWSANALSQSLSNSSLINHLPASARHA
jgi:hypothetical protein